MISFDEKGREIPNPIPVAVKIPFTRPEPLHLRMRRMILQAQAEQTGPYESFEDADDFSIEDEDFDDRSTPYEHDFDHIPGFNSPSSEDNSSPPPEAPPSEKGVGVEVPPKKGTETTPKNPPEPSV